MKKKFIILILALIVTTAGTKAQFIEDALRYSVPNGMITARTANLGVAYHGFADDIGALFYNPAGIGIIRKSEFSFGMSMTRNNTETDFLDSKEKLSTNNYDITHLGIIEPFKTGKSSAAIGIGYFLESDFDNNMDFQALNPFSTYTNSEAVNGPFDYDMNFATDLKLANENYYTPVKDSLEQTVSIIEDGGLHNVTGAISYNINEYASVGFGISGKWGSYKYTRFFNEADNLNIYDVYDEENYTNIDFGYLDIKEKIEQDISGISGSVGFMGRLDDFMRIGVSVKLPTYYEIEERSSQEATTVYDNGDEFNYEYDGRTSYKVTTPFVFGAGVSFHAEGLTFASGVEYTDVTQLEFSDAPEGFDVEKMNMRILRELIGQTKWGFGIEWQVPGNFIDLRASFTSVTSPYSADISNASISTIAGGAGLYFGDNVRLDAVIRWSDYSELRTLYDDVDNMGGNTYIYTNQPMSAGIQLIYRY